MMVSVFTPSSLRSCARTCVVTSSDWHSHDSVCQQRCTSGTKSCQIQLLALLGVGDRLGWPKIWEGQGQIHQASEHRFVLPVSHEALECAWTHKNDVYLLPKIVMRKCDTALSSTRCGAHCPSQDNARKGVCVQTLLSYLHNSYRHQFLSTVLSLAVCGCPVLVIANKSFLPQVEKSPNLVFGTPRCY